MDDKLFLEERVVICYLRLIASGELRRNVAGGLRKSASSATRAP